MPIRTEETQIKRRLALYNIVPNIVWSVINLVPVSVFCYILLDLTRFCIFITISLTFLFLPRTFFDAIQLAQSTRLYKKLGVPFINQFTQDGDIINRLLRKRFPDYKAVHFNRTSMHKRWQQTYMFEAFHFMLFVFFLLTTLFALYKGYWIWAAVLSVTNSIYNIYPNLLQQYIRVKLKPHVQLPKRKKPVPVFFVCQR